MRSNSRILEDLARVAGGAVSTVVGIKSEIESAVRQQIERLLSDADMVPRDEFDAIKAVAQKARSEQEALTRRVAKLEAKLGTKPTAARAAGPRGTQAASRGKAKKKTAPAAKPKPRKAARKARPRRTPAAKGATR